MASRIGTLPASHAALPFLAGVLAALLLHAPLATSLDWALLVAVLACLAVQRLRMLACLGAGFLCCQVALLDHFERVQRDDERYLVEARILGIPAYEDGGVQLDAWLTFRRTPRPALRARLRLRAAADAPVAAGDTWQLSVRLRPPRDARNPGAVDMERNLLRDHVHALGEVVATPLNRRLAQCPSCLDARRAQLAAWIRSRVADRDSAALLAALAVGATGEVSREQWRVFNATGITHLVAISGMHVTLFAWVAMAAARRAWRPLASLTQRLGWAPRRESFAALLGVALAAGYSLMAGFSVPTQRTLVMLGAWLLLRAAARAAPFTSSLGLALVVVLVLDPFAALAAGFWLSFGAVGAIMLLCAGRAGRHPWWRESLRVQLGVTAALVPATLAVFGSVSLAGLLVNLGAIPVIGFVLVPLVLAAAATRFLAQLLHAGFLEPLAGGVLWLAAIIYEWCWPLLAAAADAPLALWHAAPAGGWYVLAIGAALVVLLPWPSRLRAATAALLLALLLPRNLAPERGGLHVHVLDMGRGLAVVVRTAGHVLLYGSGESFGSGGSAVERNVLPFLRSQGVHAVDVLVLPALERDAAAGALALQAALPVRAIVVGGARATPLALGSARACTPQRWQWEGVRFALLGERAATAAAACILRVETDGGSALLPGDADADMERALVAAGEPLASELVIVPRHAAGAASTTTLVHAVRARYAVAVVRAGATGSASFAAVRERWQSAGARFLVTADSGALTFHFEPGQATAAPRAARTARSGVWRMR